ncbi:MAG: hypothetical protein VKK98_06490 [Cyanobacteriota bacterium]|nr:hypothetical protein [Cyanobacteriota bacterium]
MFKIVTLLALPSVLAITACSPEKQSAAHDVSCQSPGDLTELSGVYSADMVAISQYGKKVGSSTLDIKVDGSGVVTGTYSWEAAEGYGSSAGGGKVSQDSEKVIGVFDAKDCEFGLAETEEAGIFRGRLLPDKTIDLTLVEPGLQPVVKLLRYKKTGDS